MSERIATEEIERLLKESTPGEWQIHWRRHDEPGTHPSCVWAMKPDGFADRSIINSFGCPAQTSSVANAELIALAPTLARELLALRRENEWISVKDRLPEASGEFIVAQSCGVGQMYFHADHADGPRFHFNGVTHWRPLPAPPEPAEKQEPTK